MKANCAPTSALSSGTRLAAIGPSGAFSACESYSNAPNAVSILVRTRSIVWVIWADSSAATSLTAQVMSIVCVSVVLTSSPPALASGPPALTAVTVFWSIT